jgi:penicillin-binding protein 2
MPVFNNNRSTIIQIIFASVFLVIVFQLINIQLISSKYKTAAENNAILRKVIYPNRGIIYDRKKKSLLENTIMYDLVVTPALAKGIDTIGFCSLLNIDTADYRKRIVRVISKNGNSVKPGIFEALLSPEKYARLSENMYRFPGFILNERSVRLYPFDAAANVLGYLSEVDTSFLKRHKDEGYEMGDYAGMTGLERSYEKVLMGQRGIQRLIRDKQSRNLGSLDNGEFDTLAKAGKNLYSSIDIELQKLGEKLMSNKVGGIVAINPKTGGILCMVSAPTYNPNFLTGSDRKKHFSDLFIDPRKPLMNRPVGNYYSPGSTFKTFVGIVAMNEQIINDRYSIGCGGAYYGCSRMGCHAKGSFTLRNGIAESCNSYFASVYRKIIDSDIYPSKDSALNKFNQYAYSFGMGNKLGIDMPSEKRGIIPTSEYYRKIFGPKWNSCNIVSNSIGQGEVSTTLTQLANVMATIANKGYFYTPHLIDSIEGGDIYDLLAPYKSKHITMNIADSIFEDVHDGMQGTMDYGTGAALKIKGITMCGKTGTVENAYRGEKQKDHAFFGAFAPRNNPKIAIAVMCENAGFGATSAGPIASLLIEKFLNDTIAKGERTLLEEKTTKLKLIPKLMQIEIDKMEAAKKAIADSLKELQMDKEGRDSADAIDVEELEKLIVAPPINKKNVITPPKGQFPFKDSIPPLSDSSSGAFLNDERWLNKKYYSSI